MKKAILYIHGKGGSYLEAEQYRENCPGFDIIGVDYSDYFPWIVQNQIKSVYDRVCESYDHIYILANSIGAYFAMHTLQNCDIEKALFISPVLDMERLILDMMGWAGVSEDDLREKGEIPADFGETLSWKYLCFVRENPIRWNIPTEILYAGNDNLVSRQTVEAFVSSHNAGLTVLENGEHWFHTEEQLTFLNDWMKSHLKRCAKGKKLSEMSLEELWQLFPVCLTEHQRFWKDWYAREEALLKPLLIQTARISHIGSTAVPSIWAKPVIDILVEVPKECNLPDIRDLLVNNGYVCMSQSDKRISLNKGYTENGFADRVFHLHLRYAGDNDELYFRDYLIEHVDIAKEYEKMKLELWKKYEHNRDAYTEAKSGFVKKYTEAAKLAYRNRY